MTATRQSATPLIDAALEVVAPSFPEIDHAGRDALPADRLYLAIRLLWEKRRLLATFLWQGTLLFLLVAFFIPATYQSKTELMPPDTQPSAMSMLASLGSGSGLGPGALSMGADLLGLKTSGALFVSLLSSDTVRDDLINRFDLRGVYWVKTYRRAREKLASRTDISEDKKSGVITIVVTDRNPQRASAMARAYIEQLNRMVLELNTSAAHRERLFLEERLKVVKQDLDQSARSFSEFSSKNTAIDIKEQGRAMVEAAATVQGEMIAAESELRGLEQIYTAKNVRVRSVRARVAELQRQLNKLAGVSGDSSNDPLNNEALYPSIRQLPVLGVTYADRFRRVKIDEAVYEALTKQYELARVEEAKQVPSVKVIDIANPPEKRSGPPRLLISVGGALFSLCLGAIWVFAKEAWINTDAADGRKLLAQEIAATIGHKIMWNKARDVSLKIVPRRIRNRFNGNSGRAE
jgi:capsule polysaccharide export protein KpsE/RkpR